MYRKLRLLGWVLLVLLTSAFPLLAQATVTDYTNPATLASLIERNAGDYTLIDVRTPAEYGSGHIPTAVNIPYDVIADHLPAADPDSLIIVYCVSGRRAGIAERTLRAHGFTNVVNFGGISRWQGRLETRK